MSEHRIVIADGVAAFVYADALAPLLDMGEARVARASHVEPASTYCGGCNRPFVECQTDTRPGPCDPMRLGHSHPPIAAQGWVADMRPSGGLVLGTYLFREDALAAEREWLLEHRGL